MIEIIIFSSIIVMLMGILYSSSKDQKSYQMISFSLFLLNLILGIIYSVSLLIDPSVILDPRISTTVSMVIYYVLSAVFLLLSASGMENEKVLCVSKKQNSITINGSIFFLILGSMAILGAAVMYLLYVLESPIVDYVTLLSKNRHISVSIAISIFAVISIVLLSGYVNVEFKTSVSIGNGDRILVTHRKRPIYFLLAILLFIFANIAVGYLSIGNIYEGQLDEISDGGDILGSFYWAIMGNPLFILTVFLVTIGALAKVVSANKTIGLVSNVLLLWWPGFSWVLAMMGLIEAPNAIMDLVQGVEFIAYILNIVTYGTLIFGLTAGINAMIGIGGNK